MHIPTKLIAFAKQANAQVWLNAIPAVVSELALKWNLEVGDAYPDCGVSYVAPATQQGVPVVLKVQWPHAECQYEADALEAWNGNGAVRLLARDRLHHALLLEHCSPGDHLAAAKEADPIGVLIDVLPRLWKTVGQPFATLAEESSGWQPTLYPNWQLNPSACEKSLIDSVHAMISELANSQGDQVLLHQDLHGHNVLASTRAMQPTWLAIDPKPLVGEREFALSPIIRSVEFGATKADVLYRLDRLTEAFSLDRKRTSGWAAIQAVAWSFGSHNQTQHYEIAHWLLATQ